MTNLPGDLVVRTDANSKDRRWSLAPSSRKILEKGSLHNECLVSGAAAQPPRSIWQHSLGPRKSYFREGLNNRHLNKEQKHSHLVSAQQLIHWVTLGLGFLICNSEMGIPAIRYHQNIPRFSRKLLLQMPPCCL